MEETQRGYAEFVAFDGKKGVLGSYSNPFRHLTLASGQFPFYSFITLGLTGKSNINNATTKINYPVYYFVFQNISTV